MYNRARLALCASSTAFAQPGTCSGTSLGPADAAGLPILSGLARYDTVPTTREAFTPPASHWASSVTDTNAPPMGMRLRLKASFDISGFSPANQAILKALQHYGLILADNGSALYVTGVSDGRWGSDLDSLKTVPASAFEVVQMNPVYTNANVPTGSAPVIASFGATPAHVASGGSVTLSWSATDSQYAIVSPGAGAVRGSSVTVTPTATTTYTLYATNQYGRTSATVTVNVP